MTFSFYQSEDGARYLVLNPDFKELQNWVVEFLNYESPDISKILEGPLFSLACLVLDSGNKRVFSIHIKIDQSYLLLPESIVFANPNPNFIMLDFQAPDINKIWPSIYKILSCKFPVAELSAMGLKVLVPTT